MGLIPDDIKAVERPENTDVRLINNRYYVYPYKSYWNKIKKKPMKKTYPYVGKIELDPTLGTYSFVPRKSILLGDKPEVKIYGDFAFIDLLGHDLYDELVTYYGKDDGVKIYVYSVLRLIYGDTSSSLEDCYIHSYISEVYPDVPVSKNTISTFIHTLGSYENSNKEFLIHRVKQDNTVLIFDGTQIINESDDSALSEFGKSAHKTNRKQICEIKVYNTVSKEPVYYEVIPGNVIDKTAFIQVLERFNVDNSIIIVDKGFNSKDNIEYLKEHNINFIVPYNDNSKIITEILTNNKYQTAFKWNEKSIKGLKASINGNHYYIFQDPYIRANQESGYITKIENEKEGYSIDKLNKQEDKFGVICFQSNIDIEDISKIYSYYKQRWDIEVNVKLEKNSMDSNVIRAHGTTGTLGVRYLVQIEMILMSRIYFRLKELGLLKKKSIRQVLEELSKTYMQWKAGVWRISISTKKKQTFLNALGILK